MDSSRAAHLTEGAELEALVTQPKVHRGLEEVAQIGAVTLVSGLHPCWTNE
jgi:hypothetical protein